MVNSKFFFKAYIFLAEKPELKKTKRIITELELHGVCMSVQDLKQLCELIMVNSFTISKVNSNITNYVTM